VKGTKKKYLVAKNYWEHEKLRLGKKEINGTRLY
jgi:hypothetical protein